MEQDQRDKYLAAVDRFKPHLVDWSRRIRVLAADEEARGKAEYERVMSEGETRPGDGIIAEVWPYARLKTNHEFMVRESELSIFGKEDSWRRPWSDVEEDGRNAFFKLFLGHVPMCHFRGSSDAAMPDFRVLLIGLLEDDAKFIQVLEGRS